VQQSYLTLDEYREKSSLLPPDFVDEVERAHAGFVIAQLEEASALIESQLRKRYRTPFDPVPTVCRRWLARIVDHAVMLRRGYSPTDEQAGQTERLHDAALAEIRRAADAVEGDFDLPLRTDADGSGIRKGGPRSYSEGSPYVWRSIQRERGRREDRQRGGTRR